MHEVAGKIFPKVSVVIPNYNYLNYLKAAITSVLSQDYPNVELIVVDDGSTDGSIEYLRSLENKIILLVQPNSGQSCARNFGLLQSTGEFICFLDADDYWDKTKISKQVDLLIKESVDLVYSGVNLVTEDGARITETLKPSYAGEIARVYQKYPARGIVLLGSSNAIFRKSLIHKSGIFDVNISVSSDWDFFRRYCDFGKVAFLSEPLTYYRQHQENMSKHSSAFVADTVHCMKKLLMDNRQRLSKLEKLRIRRVTYNLVAKYVIKRYLIQLGRRMSM